jgi:N-methylhydantoinase A
LGNYRVAVDTGGTFSDFVFVDEQSNEFTIAKIPSTPDDPSRAILEGISQLIASGVPAEAIRHFCHGTTVGTNALLEEKGAPTGLLVTDGFRGIYEVQEQSRPHGAAIFDITYDRPALLAPARHTVEVPERVGFDGSVLQPLNEAELRSRLQPLVDSGIESVAVCLLFSFLQPAHEQRVREIVNEVLPGVSVSISSDIIPQLREYYRLSTTVINAYLQPMLARYIANLDDRLNGLGVEASQKYIMQSNGGMSTFAATARKAVATVLSGPAGGITTAVNEAQTTGYRDLVTFDMGGTSCDVALIRDARPSVANRGKINGRDLALPMIEINTVSAGGGTIARAGSFGTLEVGPDSAGAVPGPACYGRGGEEPTITDCNLVLGYLSPGNFNGGGMALDLKAARRAIARVAEPLGMSIPDAAEGIIRIINVKMQEAVKAISTMRGHNLGDFMMLGFGGAGPVHAARVAEDLGMAGVIIPLYPGVYSATGLVMSDVKHDYIQSRLSRLAETDYREINQIYTALEQEARGQLGDEGFSSDDARIEYALDMRYAGQGYEITMPVSGLLTEDGLGDLRAQFDQQHESMFGHSAPQEVVEVVSYRVRCIGTVTPLTAPVFEPQGVPAEAAIREWRSMHFDGETRDCPVFQRERLDVGAVVDGPAAVDQTDCTTVIFPRQRARVDQGKNLIIEMGAR